VFSFADRHNVILIPDTSELLLTTRHIWNIYTAQGLFLFIRTTATFGINSQVNKTLGKTAELKIKPQDINFIKQILSLLAYGGSSVSLILNYSPFDMQKIRFLS
jgi:hypothetical protein